MTLTAGASSGGSARPSSYTSRGLMQDKASGLSGDIPGNHAEVNVRDVSSLMGYLPATITDENVVQVVRALVELIQGPISREISVMGRYINDRGETGRLSRALMNRLDDLYGP